MGFLFNFNYKSDNINSMEEIKNILFDFNGTLVDDLDLCLDLLNEMLESCHHKSVNKDEYLEIFDFPVIEYYKKAGFVFPEDNFPVLADYFIKQYSSRNKECPIFDNVIEILNYFKSIGKNLFIVSASEKTLLLNQLKQYKIDEYFNDVSGLDNINATSKIESAKKFILEKKLDLSKTIFVGDTLHDFEVSKVLGVDCILISKGHQSKKRLLNSKCLVIDDIVELKNIIY